LLSGLYSNRDESDNYWLQQCDGLLRKQRHTFLRFRNYPKKGLFFDLFDCSILEWEGGVMNESVPMTRQGYDRLKAEVNRLETEEMPMITEKLAEARAEGDLKENAEYHAQRENQGMLMAKINEIKFKLANASIIDTSSLPKDTVSFGASVRVKDMEFGDEETFTLVGSGDEDYQTGKILVSSPIGQALLGRKVGEVAEVNAPAGLLKFEVLGISFE